VLSIEAVLFKFATCDQYTGIFSSVQEVIPGLLAVSKYLPSYGIVIKRVSTLFCTGLFSLVVFILNDQRITDAEMQFF
jgi:hypothetical protein